MDKRDFIKKTIMKKVMKDVLLKLMFNILKLHDFHNDFPFLPEKMKIEKVKNLAANLHDKTGYVIHITYHGLVLKKVHSIIKFNQNAWLKPYIDENTDLRKKAENDFKKDFFKLINNAVFGKTIENVSKNRY